MREHPQKCCEAWRRQGRLPSPAGASFGQFSIPFLPTSGGTLQVVVCYGNESGWDHVSVSLPTRCPTWREMCYVKDLFFKPDECVFQFHPPDDLAVNLHPYCLHLWRCQQAEFPMPPRWMI